MSTPSNQRNADAALAIGVDAWSKAVGARLLMVGAGGIGCELLKDLVMAGFERITIIDLDTIDVSNLNRQFLFQKQHVKKSKAHIAKESALRFNPNVQIESLHNSIFESKFNVEWFRSFDLVMNALDNIPARKHVNMMCRAASRPLIESGTAGYLGQVAVHLKNTQCFDCEPKPTPKTFPVCTIRSTPSTPIHCIVWSKSYLFNLLFGKDEDDNAMAVTADENAKEIEDLKREANELAAIKNNINSANFGELVFTKIFTRDIERLTTMTQMWEDRKPPVPLQFKALTAERKGLSKPAAGVDRNMKVWSLVENFHVFSESVSVLAKRMVSAQQKDAEFSMSFDKDDEDALDFVTAVTNLRAHIYGIETQSRFKVKEMAGNIIPAISTTNAIIAGLMVLQAFKILDQKYDECKNTYLVHGGQRTHLICGENPPAPSRECGTCQAGYFELCVDVTTFTLSDFVNLVLTGRDERGLAVEGEITINEAGRMIYDPDFDDNGALTFKELKIENGGRILVLVDNDDDESKSLSINFFVVHKDGMLSFDMKGDRKIPPRASVKQAVPVEPAAAEKRTAEGDANDGERKKLRVDNEVIVADDDVIVL
ncbi:hypothetical protein CcCBS67573_g02289 [Chytriomyces confervae]|uniref:Ubiquitin-activating enzyme E1-like n=1 Tax=Chytriomyces confervae TaxID=246404 RepID=A0A507FM96_9FUNG|nr:E1 ubiquitin-activating protein uba2 [Chytriomyces hyalinus]TPX76436.1 hypothetical protein CcCBS67573_g02289 [Chytriomyces confervae]